MPEWGKSHRIPVGYGAGARMNVRRTTVSRLMESRQSRRQDMGVVRLMFWRAEGPFDNPAASCVESSSAVDSWLKYLGGLLVQERLRELAERSDS